MEITDILLYGLILVAKVIEVSIATMRIMLITKGERLVGAILGFFEVMIWVVIVSTVLKDITEDPIKVVIYALGFSIGNYVGSILESKLAFGNTTIMCVLDGNDCDTVDILREKGHAVTVIEGEGRDSKKKVLMIFAKRKKVDDIIGVIRDIQPKAIITTSDVKPVGRVHGIVKK